MKHFWLPLGVALVLANPVRAGDAGPMWVFPVSRLCVAQDPRYAGTLLGQMILEGPLKLQSASFAQCASTRRWMTPRVCDEVMGLQSETDLSRSNLERLGARLAPDLSVLQVAGPYVKAAEEAEAAGRPPPPCP